MKKIIIPFLLLSFFFGNAQNTEIKIDYTVDYIVPSGRKKTNDTISIGYANDGKYIWTDNKNLAKSLGKTMFRSNPGLMENANLSVIYNTQEGLLMMCFESGKNRMFFSIELSKIIPGPSVVSEEDEENEFELISENTNETIDILDKNATVYDIYPSNKDTDIISIAFDESVKIDNTQLFKNLFQIMLAADGKSGMLGIDIPDGMIMKVSNKGETLLEAVNVDTTSKTININYSFKITE